VTAANVNDGKRLDQVLQAIVIKRKCPPLRRNKHLCADAGYRSAENLRIIDEHGYIAHVVDRKREADAKRRHPNRKARRWVVEVAHSWFTNEGHDRNQLAPMAIAAREAMGKAKLQAVADRGYYSGTQIKDCDDAGIAPMLPKPATSNAKAEGRFGKADFIYIARDDEYRCPAGQRAIYRFTREENGLQIRRYWSSACPQCPIKKQCTPSDYRRISRWEHEPVLDAAQRRLDMHPNAMTVRRRTVEHVFGTFKHWMGSTHFLMRTLPNVGTEMSLHVIAYNLKRLIGILGIARTIKAMRLLGA